MNNATEILDQGFACLVENLGVVNAEHIIALIKRESFDYMVWQREYFDKFLVIQHFRKSMLISIF